MSDQPKTAAQAATEAGFKSLQHLSDTVDVSRRTLTNWFIHNPKRFDAILAGGLAMNGGKLEQIKKVIDYEYV